MEQTRKYIYDGTKNISYRYNQIIRFDKTAFTTTQKKRTQFRMKIKSVKQKTLSIQLKYKPATEIEIQYLLYIFIFKGIKNV